MTKTPEEATASMIANYERNTGKPFAAWVALMKKEKLAKHGEIVKRLSVAPKGRLEASGSFNAMVTHRVRVANPKGIDAELVGWLKAAYDAA
jgi:hypothetical protein